MVVDSKAISLPPLARSGDFLRISDANMLLRLHTREPRQNGTLWTVRLKERFIRLTMRPVAAHDGLRGRDGLMSQPKLLLIDDEPVLADFIATAAGECGF